MVDLLLIIKIPIISVKLNSWGPEENLNDIYVRSKSHQRYFIFGFKGAPGTRLENPGSATAFKNKIYQPGCQCICSTEGKNRIIQTRHQRQ